MNFIKKNQAREFLGKNDMRMSADFIDFLNEELEKMLSKSILRATENGRTTVMKHDF